MKRPKDRAWKGEVSAAAPLAKHKRQLRSGYGGQATFSSTPGDVAVCPKKRK